MDIGVWNATIGRNLEKKKDRDTTVVMIAGSRDVVRSLAMVVVFKLNEMSLWWWRCEVCVEEV